MSATDPEEAAWCDYAEAQTYSRISIGLRALLKARVRCLSVDDILRRLEATPIVAYEQRGLLFLRLRDSNLTDQDAQRLRNLLRRLEAEGELSKSRPGARITGLIKEILMLLPNDDTVAHCLRYLKGLGKQSERVKGPKARSRELKSGVRGPFRRSRSFASLFNSSPCASTVNGVRAPS